MSEFNVADFFENNEQLKPLVELIHSILDIEEETLTEGAIQAATTAINNALTPKVKQISIDGLVTSFATNNTTFDEAKDMVDITKQQTLEYINSFNPSPNKKILLDNILSILFKLFDDAIDQYIGYSLTLPIKVEEHGQVPTYAHPTDAAADIYAAEDYELMPHSLSNKIKTNIKIALPEGWAAAILPRSSIGAKTGLRLSNSIGIIDSDYRGEIGILYDNISDSAYTIKTGDRIAQMIVFPVHHFKGTTVDTLEETERGEGGFGSSGK